MRILVLVSLLLLLTGCGTVGNAVLIGVGGTVLGYVVGTSK